MPPLTKKLTLGIDAQLYEELVAIAEQNGQTKQRVLEQALKFYLRNVVPSQHPGPPRGDGCLRAIGCPQP